MRLQYGNYIGNRTLDLIAHVEIVGYVYCIVPENARNGRPAYCVLRLISIRSDLISGTLRTTTEKNCRILYV